MVDCGKKGSYQICCGGSNVAAGLYVPVALPGTVFEKAGMTIEPRKMRGIESNGMICSKEELWINEDIEKHSIWSLTEDLDDLSDADLGTALSTKFPRLEGWVMDVDSKSLTNRPDLTGHFGAATELNAIYWHKIQDTWFKDNKAEKTSSIMNHESWITFNKIKDYHEQCVPWNIMQILKNSTQPERKVIGESDGLNSYVLLHLKNITVHQASFFMRLQMIDLWSNSINNRVDFSNLFMNISGQPIHFFDAEKVDGDIIVRNAKDGEKFTDLFETQHTLKSSDIVIADQKKILALAGVVWGLESGITENTKNILVEIANFDAVAVRKTGTRLSLRTDAELRFEKNINPRYTLFCLTLFLDELNYYKKDLGNFEIGGLSYYIHEKMETLKNGKMIEVDTKAMEQFIFGQKVKGFDKKAEEILSWLGFIQDWKMETLKNGKIKLICPLWRGPDDLNIQEDIYEDVARIYGYDQIDNLPLLSTTTYIPYNEYVALQRKIENILVRNIHCNQVETYPRVSEKELNELGGDANILYTLQNPVNPEKPYLRAGMHYELLNHTAKNSKFFDEFKIFDIGKIRKKSEKNLKNLKDASNENFASSLVNETSQLGILLYKKHIASREQDTLLEGKTIVATLLKELGITQDIIRTKTDGDKYHPKKQATIEVMTKDWPYMIGFIGNFHPLVLSSLKIPENAGVTYIGLDIDKLVALTQNENDHIYTFETLQDQIIRRDLCFVIDANKSFDDIISAVKNVDEVKEVEVFDVYAGKNLGDDKKSVSIKIKITGNGDTTTDQINDIMNKAIKAGESAGGSLRG